MYAVYRELHPPTGVEHCAECHFFGRSVERSLVVASTSLLSVFNLAAPQGATEAQKGSKLVQVGEYRLFGNVASLETVRLGQAPRDSLLLGFRDAKLSVVEYDPETNDIKTTSLHCFEDDELKGGVLHNISRPVLRVDPEGRCAVMLAYGTHLAVLPFRHDTSVLDDQEGAESASSPTHGERSEILPSFTVALGALSERVVNVKDLHFLHGYNSPTLFLLYEATPTWAGRITLRRDTCSIVAISLNLSDKSSPVIWHAHGLPFDLCYCLPIPRPIGGMLLMGANCLLYLNQSTPTLGVSLNSLTETTTAFPLRHQSPLPLSLDCSQAAVLSEDQAVVLLKGGEIFVLTLLRDGMRGVRNILFEKAAAGVLASCVCTLGERHLFLGSRLGNSLLLSYSKKIWNTGEEVEPAPKRLKAEENILGEDPDELEVYGPDVSSGPTLASYKFEVCDSVLNIGPIGNLTVGEPAFLSEEFLERVNPDLELVTCSGHGKNGALCVLQRGVRPQVVTTFELPGCSDMWTVLSNPEQLEGEEMQNHAYLLLSRQDSTMVLQTGQEITELDSSGFATQVPTVFAGNMCQGKYIVQVTCTDIRLLKGVKQLCRLALDMGGGVRSCDLTGRLAVVLLVSGSLALVELVEGGGGEEGEASFSIAWPDIDKGSKVTLISTFCDASGMFKMGSGSDPPGAGPDVISGASGEEGQRERMTSAEEEEQLLYGDIATLTSAISNDQQGGQSSAADGTTFDAPSVETHWCALYREDGSLEIYQVPEFKLVFCVRNFSSAPKTLMDSGPMALPKDHHPGNPHSSEQTVDEILLVGLGPERNHTHLLALVDKELVVYKAFPFRQQSTGGHLQIRFSKVKHKVLLHDRKEKKLAKQLSQQQPEGGREPRGDKGTSPRFTPKLRMFSDVGGYSGVFVCGSYPHWLIVTGRGAPHLHPCYIDGPLASFAPFHNVNCPRGFLYFNREGELRICVLPSHLSYDSAWPVRKVPTRCSTHYVTYHMESKTHAVVTSEQKPVSEAPVGDDPEDMQPIERGERFIPPMEDRFYLQLFSPTSWEPVPNSKHALERYDRVTTMKVMRLRSQETLSGRKEYIVLGCTSVSGEDVGCTGKMMIFDVIEVIPEPGKPLTKHKLKCLYNQPQKGTISALEAVDGLILACMGQKIFMWHFKDNKDLMGIAFLDTEIYIHRACALKNFILIADISRSVLLLRYQETLRTLSVVSKDQFPSEVYSCEYMIDGQHLGFVASDSDQNLILYQYQPETPESEGGLYLTRRGDFNVGAHVNAFFRVCCKPSAPLGAPHEIKALLTEKRHCTFFASLDGAIGCLLPVPEKTYRRLMMLQVKLVNGLPHVAGLNPKAFRLFHSRQQYLYAPQRNMLDGELLWRYPQLSCKERSDFAKQIGTTQAQIMDDLKEMDKVSAHF